MAIKLTKNEVERQTKLVAELREQEAAMEAAIEVFNFAMESARVDLRETVEKYNEVISEVNGFALDIATRLQDEIDEKSEKWQESEKGEAAVAFKDEWEQIDGDELDADEIAPNDIDEMTFEAADALEAISTEPESSY